MKLSTFALYAISTIFNSVSATPTQGCSRLSGPSGGSSLSGSIQSGGRTRTYIIDFPRNYNNAASNGGSPLVVAFHGARRDPSFFKSQSQYSNPSLNPDHVTVYPQGVNGFWQGSPYADKSVNDIQFINALLTRLSNQYCLDKSRFYASGHSNGGGLTNTIACWPGLSRRFAAFAANAAAIYKGSRGPNDVCKPDHQVTPMLETHGQMDNIIPYPGGSVANGLSTTPGVLSWLRDWVTRNGCATSEFQQNVPFPGKVTRWNSDRCKVRHFAFAHMMHFWPTNGTYIPEGDFKTPLEATLTALAWFRANSN